MPAVQRQGDTDSGGGVALSGVVSVRVNNIPVVVDGISVSGHGRGPHAGPVLTLADTLVPAALLM